MSAAEYRFTYALQAAVVKQTAVVGQLERRLAAAQAELKRLVAHREETTGSLEVQTAHAQQHGLGARGAATWQLALQTLVRLRDRLAQLEGEIAEATANCVTHRTALAAQSARLEALHAHRAEATRQHRATQARLQDVEADQRWSMQSAWRAADTEEAPC